MATAGSHLSEDQFLCSICLSVFTQPVSLPCGHNFCKACITECFNSTASGLCRCPMCKETFNTRPELRVNCFISEMADHFRKSVEVTEEQEREGDVPGGMSCVVCIDPKMKAVKTCLVCLTSYCETHLEPHRRVQTLKTHQLVEPLGSMEDRMCKKHNKILELFCRVEQRCICMLCSQTDHRSHNVVALEDESGKRKEVMKKTKTECEQKIQEREQKLQEIRRSAEVNQEVAEKETADGMEVLTALVASIQKRMAELLEAIERKQKAVQQKAEQSITELQQEISQVLMTSMECEKLSRSEDHLEVLMYSLPSPSTTPPCSDWSEFLMDNKISAGTVRAAMTKMEKTLNEGMGALIKQLGEHHRQVPPQADRPLSSAPPQQPPSIRRADQVAQDEEIAWRLMEKENKEYEKNKEKKKEKKKEEKNKKPHDHVRPHILPNRPLLYAPPPYRHSLQSLFNITCDGCGCNLSLTHHHHCTLCRNYDLCPACFSMGYHMEHHPFLRIVFGDVNRGHLFAQTL